jgi:hypothetical protein
MTHATAVAHPARGASITALFAGLWLFLSPWIYGAYGSSGGWNNWIVGALIFLLGLMRMNRPAATGLSWLNAALAVWTFVSPWVCRYSGNTGLMLSSLFVGLIVFCAALAGANSERMSHDRGSTA